MTVKIGVPPPAARAGLLTMIRLIDRFNHRQKQLVLVGLDLVTFALGLYLAFALRKNSLTPDFQGNYFWILGVIALARIPVFVRLGLYRAVLRYPSNRLGLLVMLGTGISMLFSGTGLYLLDLRGDPRSVLLLEALFSTFLVFLGRELLATWMRRAARQGDHEPVLIYGAGVAGMQLAQTLKLGDRYQPVAFLDDEPSKWGVRMVDLPVYAPAELSKLVQRYGLNSALLAAPGADARQRRHMVELLERHHLAVRQVPNFLDLVRGTHLEQVAEVRAADLLPRRAVPADDGLLRKVVPGRSVMVTGAGGSIGSEICRQVAALAPRELVLYEISEYALYSIEMELADLYPDLQVSAVLGSVLDEARLEEVFRRFDVDSVYHAAAYKHVPLVEQNPLEGVRNNVFGTYSAARAAVRAGVTSFLMVSTDKAVRPCNVMGASKRLAELACLMVEHQAQQSPFTGARDSAPTRFTIVRFGNVLDSAGSVVPRFRKQIASGGPVTVTDPDVQRFFMTIPEAAQLVVQASAMGTGGEVYLLDMGEPVRVYDLARRMVDLATRGTDRRIEIAITGLRPGEKLVEELLVDPKRSKATSHPKIFSAIENGVDHATVARQLHQLEQALQKGALAAVYGVLEQLVEGYRSPCAPQDVLRRGESCYSFKSMPPELERAAEDPPPPIAVTRPGASA
jgi:FlaA1/EpsC-like NDP-sugar epimerase